MSAHVLLNLLNELGKEIDCIQSFHLGRYIVGHTVGNLKFTATHKRSRKT